MPNTYQEEELLRLLSGMQPEKPLPAPAPADYEYTQRAQKFLGEAEELERQAAAPMVKPKGFKENFVSGARAFMEGMAQPQTPFAGAQRREAVHAQEMQQLAERANRLRSASAGQQQMGETARLRAVQESRESREATQQDFDNKKPVITHLGQGRIAQTPQAGGTSMFEGDPGFQVKDTTAGKANLQMKQAVLKGGSEPVAVNYDTDGTQGDPGRVYDLQGNDVSDQVVRLFDPGIMQAYDPNAGRNVNISRMGAAGTVAPQPAGVLDEQQTASSAAARVSSLGQLYKDDFVGPVAGRWHGIATQLPDAVLPSVAQPPEGFADFQAASSELKNDVIKAITGAQMNKNEEARILTQLPDVINKPDVWRARYNRTLQRVQIIQALKNRQTNMTDLTLEDIDAMIDAQSGGRSSLGNASQGNTPPPLGGRGAPAPARQQAPAQPQRPAIDISKWKVQRVQ